MERLKIAQYVRDLLAVCGYSEENTDSRQYDLLYHQYMAIALYETASAADHAAVDAVTKKLKVFFQCNFKLKERKRRKKEKQENTPTPPKEEIEKEEEIVKKTNERAGSEKFSDLEKRKEAFRQDCLRFVGQYDAQQVADFFHYWAEESRRSGLMLWETKKSWNTAFRLARWNNNQYTSATTAAAIRLKKTKAKQGKEETTAEHQQAVAAIREQDNERREQEQEQSRQNQELTADYLKRNPNGLLARWAREKKPLPDPPLKGKGK